MEPILAHMDADPTPTLRTTVGNSSPLNRYMVGKAIDDPTMPSDANMNLKCSTSESAKHTRHLVINYTGHTYKSYYSKSVGLKLAVRDTQMVSTFIIRYIYVGTNCIIITVINYYQKAIHF